MLSVCVYVCLWLDVCLYVSVCVFLMTLLFNIVCCDCKCIAWLLQYQRVFFSMWFLLLLLIVIFFFVPSFCWIVRSFTRSLFHCSLYQRCVCYECRVCFGFSGVVCTTRITDLSQAMLSMASGLMRSQTRIVYFSEWKNILYPNILSLSRRSADFDRLKW